MKKRLLFPLISLMALSGCTKYNGIPPELYDHVHEYSEEYSNDENYHWKEATCVHTDLRKDVEEHTFGDYVIIQDATLTSEGKRTRTCSKCGYKEESTYTSTGGGNQDNLGGENNTWTITGINCDRDNIELTVGGNPVSIVATLTGEGSFPTSMTVTCNEIEVTKIVDEEEVKETVKIAEVSSKVVESGNGFTLSALAEGETKITIASTGNPNIKKEINVKINPKVEKHSISLSKDSIEMNKGSQVALGCTATDKVTWSTSNSEIVSLENETNSGVFLIAKKRSQTPVTITATICNGTAFEMSATCQVSVVSNEQTIFNYYFINNQKLTDLNLFMWDDDGHNADWPGVQLEKSSYINKDLYEVYKITIDKDERDFKNIIISGNDSEGKFVQTSDILLSSFSMHNAFTIPELPKDVTEGSRKASIKTCTFNLETDIYDEKYVALSLDKSTLFAGNSLNVNTYTSEAEVNYEIANGEEFVELTNTSKEGFTVTGIKAGEATIRASIGDIYKEIKITVVEDEELTYYFVNNYLWTDLKVYFFSEKDGTNNAEWPGVSLGEKAYTDEKGKDVYEIKFMKLADAWEAFIVSGVDGTKEERCQTVDIKFANFGLDNAVKIDGWTDENPNKAKVKFVSYEPSNKPFLNVTGDTFVKTGTSTYLTVETNGEDVSYSVVSGSDFVELSNESNNGVNVTGKLAGTATIQVKVGEGENETVKTISFEVKDNGISYYFFLNVDCWEDVRAYLFKGDNYKEGWPGEELEVVDQDNDNKDVYVVSFDKFEEDWEYVIFSGTIDGNVENRIQTDDIPLSKLDGDLNCAYPTSWKDDKPDNKVKKYSRIQQFDFLKIGNNSKTLHVDDEWNLTFLSNKEVSFEDFDTDVVEVTLMNGYLKIKALKEGTATISVYINDGFDRISRTCEITVKDDTPEYITYYFANNYAWSDLKVFFWNEKGHNADFPGVALEGTSLKNSDGNDVFEIKFDINNEAWTHCIVSGTDGMHGWSKTKDIEFAELDNKGHNTIKINETDWNSVDYPLENQPCNKCSFITEEYVVETNRIKLSDSSINLSFNSSKEITVDATSEFTFEVSDASGVITASKNGNKILVESGDTTGEAEITVYINKGTDDEKSAKCSISVSETPSLQEYRIQNFDDKYKNDSGNVYAWVWGSGLTSKWVKLSISQDKSYFYFRDEVTSYTGCLLVTSNEDLTQHSDFPDSLISNKSEDLSFNNYLASFN